MDHDLQPTHPLPSSPPRFVDVPDPPQNALSDSTERSQRPRLVPLFGRHLLHCLVDQVLVVVPISVYFIVVISSIQGAWIDDSAQIIAGGLVAVVVGLALFIEGLSLFVMPLAELVGYHLLTEHNTWLAAAVLGVLGILATYAEPALGSLQSLSSVIERNEAPYIFVLMNGKFKELTIFIVAVGVGIGTIFGAFRFKYSWRLTPLISGVLLCNLIMTSIMAWGVPELASVVGLAWDCGGIVTGPVTVPIMLAVGIGATQGLAAKKRENTDSIISEKVTGGLGVVALASLWPVFTLQLYALILSACISSQEIMTSDYWTGIENDLKNPSDSSNTALDSFISSIRAILPLAAYLCLVVRFICHVNLPKRSLKSFLERTHVHDQITERLEVEVQEAEEMDRNDDLEEEEEEDIVEMDVRLEKGFRRGSTAGSIDRKDARFADMSADESSVLTKSRASRMSRWIRRVKSYNVLIMGFFSSLVGLIVLNLGLVYGLQSLGTQLGSVLPGLFQPTEGVPNSPLLSWSTAIFVTFIIATLLGFLSAVAEPALNVLGYKVSQISNGKFSRWTLILTVGLGAGVRLGIGVMKALYKWNAAIIVLVGFTTAWLLTAWIQWRGKKEEDGHEEELIGVGWDTSAITTGPVTVPLVLSLGLEFAATVTDAGDGSGFGMLACANVVPIVAVLLVGIIRMPSKKVTQVRSAGSSGVAILSESVDDIAGTK